jgi:type II secretory pathway pseudopilin PulG
VTRRSQTGQAGFSLIELMIALVVTMIVAGAIFGLLTAGNTAFRREPELADRQQNIRIAMSVLGEDIRRAGTSLPPFQQVFTQSMDGAGPMGPHSDNTDQIEMISTGDCRELPVCKDAGANVFTAPPLSSCYDFPARVILVGLDCDDEPRQRAWMQWAEEPGPGASSPCGGDNGHLNFPSGQDPILNPPGGPPCEADFVFLGALARYRINVDTEGTPNLERSAVGGQLDINGNDSWEVVARGIEDLQVEYLNGSGVWSDDPGTVSCATGCTNPTQADYDSIVQRVRVRLSARVMAPNLQGETASASGGRAVRGELVSEFAPTQATITIAQSKQEL